MGRAVLVLPALSPFSSRQSSLTSPAPSLTNAVAVTRAASRVAVDTGCAGGCEEVGEEEESG